jgi:hypothetical protein
MRVQHAEPGFGVAQTIRVRRIAPRRRACAGLSDPPAWASIVTKKTADTGHAPEGAVSDPAGNLPLMTFGVGKRKTAEAATQGASNLTPIRVGVWRRRTRKGVRRQRRSPRKGPRYSLNYFFFVFFAAFGFAAAFVVGFLAFFFATMGMVTP